MTHIIIPIKDIEELIKQVKKVPKYADDYEEGVAYGKKDVLEDILTQCKQISLDEKDIEEKVKEATNKHDLNGWEQIGYRKALKDLL